MADVWEKDLAQKSSLTTSDFIRVVGSDNVSYKQGMTSVLNVFNLVFSSASDMDTKLASLPTTRTFTFFSGANDVLTIFGTGSSSVRGILSRPNSTVVDFTLWTGVNPTKMYTFRMTLATHEITYQTEWPTRAEVDALKAYVVKHTRIEIATGFCRVPYPTGYNGNDTLIIQPEYDGQSIMGWTPTIQKATSDFLIYVRQGTATPADGSKITFRAIFFKA